MVTMWSQVPRVGPWSNSNRIWWPVTLILCTREESMSSKNRSPQNSELNRRNVLLGGTTLAASAIASTGSVQMAQAQQRPAQAQPAAPAGQRPNILVIFGDDIGETNISAYSFGLIGYKSTNIDRIAKDGTMF